MDIKRLKYFCSVAEELSFSKAAKKNYIAQAAMSRYIFSMEEELGFRLFKRDRSKVALTPAGEEFYKNAVRMVEDYMLALQDGAEAADQGKGWLTIGFVDLDIQYIRRFVPAFSETHPDYTIALREYDYDSILVALLNNECGVIFCPNARLGRLSDLRRVETGSESFVIAVGEKHPLYGRDSVRPEDISGQTFICAYDAKHSWFQQRQLEYTCSVYGVEPGKKIYTNSALALLSMVEMGQGVAFLTENICTYDAKVRLLPIISEKQTGRIHVAAGLSNPGNHLVDLFLDHVEQNIQK